MSAFVGEGDLCPSCRAEALEREFGLRSGLFAELVTLSCRAIERAEQRKQQRVWRRRAQYTSRGRAARMA